MVKILYKATICVLVPDVTFLWSRIREMVGSDTGTATFILLSDSAQLTWPPFSYALHFCHKNYYTSIDKC